MGNVITGECEPNTCELYSPRAQLIMNTCSLSLEFLNTPLRYYFINHTDLASSPAAGASMFYGEYTQVGHCRGSVASQRTYAYQIIARA